MLDFINTKVAVNVHHVEKDLDGWRMLERMAKGEASREVDMLMDVTKQIEGHTICAFGEGHLGQFKVYLDILKRK